MANENVISRKGVTVTLRDGKDYTIEYPDKCKCSKCKNYES